MRPLTTLIDYSNMQNRLLNLIVVNTNNRIVFGRFTRTIVRCQDYLQINSCVFVNGRTRGPGFRCYQPHRWYDSPESNISLIGFLFRYYVSGLSHRDVWVLNANNGSLSLFLSCHPINMLQFSDHNYMDRLTQILVPMRYAIALSLYWHVVLNVSRPSNPTIVINSSTNTLMSTDDSLFRPLCCSLDFGLLLTKS